MRIVGNCTPNRNDHNFDGSWNCLYVCTVSYCMKFRIGITTQPTHSRMNRTRIYVSRKGDVGGISIRPPQVEIWIYCTTIDQIHRITRQG